MPKKTKKEKIIANYRRKIKLLYHTNIQKEYPKENKKESKKDIRLEKKIDKEKINFDPKGKKYEYDNKFLDYNLIEYFKNDFKKSLLVSFFIIALEFVIYFAMLKIKLY